MNNENKNILTLEVDFQGVKSKIEILSRLNKVFGLPETSNWDSFYDYFTSLDSDSKIIRDLPMAPNGVHLVIKKAGELKNIKSDVKDFKDQYEFFRAIMDDATRPDGHGLSYIPFTYVIID